MKVKYDKETDILYIRLSDIAIDESDEDKDGIILDYSANGQLVGIEVLNVSKTRHNSYTVAQITKLIAPSGETSQEYYKTASDFAGKNQTGDAFEKSVETEKLNKRIAENIVEGKEGEKALPGLENPKDLIRWTFKSKKGDISPVFEFKDRFAVTSSLTSSKGAIPFSLMPIK